MTSLLKRGLVLALFTTGLLAGLQLPGFAQQYKQQLNARLAEAELSLSGFQAVADDFHNGELAALIEHHRRSRDASFRAEADVIYAQWKRVAVLNNEQAALSGSLATQLWHLLWGGNRELLNATARGYSNVVPLNTTAVVSGVIGGLLLIAIAMLGQIVFRPLLRHKAEPRRDPAPIDQQLAIETAISSNDTTQLANSSKTPESPQKA